jgi:hypothetical protein
MILFVSLDRARVVDDSDETQHLSNAVNGVGLHQRQKQRARKFLPSSLFFSADASSEHNTASQQEALKELDDESRVRCFCT